MPSRSRLTLVGLVASAYPVVAIAAPTLDPVFSSHSVVQRRQPITISGSGAPGERISVSLGSSNASVRAGKDGRWSASLPAQPEGGPYRLNASSPSGVAAADDVMVGDVWLCSGQSNMEFPLSRALNGPFEVESASDPQLRLLKVPQRALLDPAPLDRSVAWQPTSPTSAANFSAACYFMGRDLRTRDKNVPIGLIDSTWGGTAIRSWMDSPANRAGGNGEDADLLAAYQHDRSAGLRRFADRWATWWRSRSGDAPGREPWVASDRLQWQPVPAFTYWEKWGRPEFAQFDGGVWFRKRVTLTAEQARKPATLTLGVVDDADTTFVNGVLVGSTYSWSAPRSYALATGVLHGGTNELLVFVRDNYSNGGFQGPAERVGLHFGAAGDLPLGSGWELSVAPSRIGEPPVAPWDGQSGVGTLYSGMIAPLGALKLAGVAWYQGEADIGKGDYARRLTALMGNWRRQFGQPELPFLIVGLAGWGTPSAAPKESGWAEVIDAQRRAVSADRHAALVSAIDLGEPSDIHPPNKQEVGRRLALAARKLAMGQADGKFGPMPLSAVRTPTGVLVRFSKRLQSLSGAPIGLELCGAAQGSCRFASATIAGDAVLLTGARASDTRVRHAWGEFPIVNLTDMELLPVPVFELPIGQ